MSQVCRQCSRPFEKHPQAGRHFYCSKACQQAFHNTGAVKRKRNMRSRYNVEFDGPLNPPYCEVCGSTHRLHLDHDHVTGVVRGVLCSECNLALGKLKDDPERILGLHRYLTRETANV